MYKRKTILKHNNMIEKQVLYLISERKEPAFIQYKQLNPGCR